MNKQIVVVARCYDKRGRLISRATNSYTKTHPLQARYAKIAGEPKKQYLHAELHALLRAGDAVVHTLVVERYTADGAPACAKPCKICSLAIKDWGVKKIIYT